VILMVAATKDLLVLLAERNGGASVRLINDRSREEDPAILLTIHTRVSISNQMAEKIRGITDQGQKLRALVKELSCKRTQGELGSVPGREWQHVGRGQRKSEPLPSFLIKDQIFAAFDDSLLTQFLNLF